MFTTMDKAVAGGAAAPISLILIWAFEMASKIDIPPTVEAAVGVVVGFALVYFTNNKVA